MNGYSDIYTLELESATQDLEVTIEMPVGFEYEAGNLLIGEETGCFTEKALEEDDFDLCSQIDDPEGVIYCRESVFENIKDRKNPDGCGISSDCLDF